MESHILEKTMNEQNSTESKDTQLQRASNDGKILPKRQQNRSQRRTRKIVTLVRQPQFHLNEFVWAHVRGFPYWPGVIEEVDSKGKYNIHFFGDYTRAKLGRNSIIQFYEGFEQHSYDKNGNAKLQKAINEARVLLLTNEKIDECLVCRIPKMQKDFLESRPKQ